MSISPRKFTVIDESFSCIVCKSEVLPLGYTARNHCNHCLCSLHLDINPGDRASKCKGVLRPVGVIKAKKGVNGLKIIHRCDKCGATRKNIVADDDNYDLIIKLSNPY